MREVKRWVRRALARGVVPACYYAVKRTIWRLNRGKQSSLLPKVTVILPVYNVEAFVADAVHSIRGQGYGNLEVIAVNDGATDGSLSILEAIAKRDSRLKIHTKPNGGLGAARNTGAALVKDTDYLLFVDKKAVGVIEAKREEEGQHLTVHESQTEGYAAAKLKWVNKREPLPFLYEAARGRASPQRWQACNACAHQRWAWPCSHCCTSARTMTVR